jgi:hypothetical protein
MIPRGGDSYGRSDEEDFYPIRRFLALLTIGDWCATEVGMGEGKMLTWREIISSEKTLREHIFERADPRNSLIISVR